MLLGLDLQMLACASPSDPVGRAGPGMGWGSRAVLGVVPRGVCAGGPGSGQGRRSRRCGVGGGAGRRTVLRTPGRGEQQ